MVVGAERPRDLWPWHKEILATVEAAVVSATPGSRPRLERVLEAALTDFKELLQNPSPSVIDKEMIKTATTEV